MKQEELKGAVLKVIAENGPINQKDISVRLKIDINHVNKLVSLLQFEGKIESMRSPGCGPFRYKLKEG